jgi:hypothetical protein
MRIIRLSGILLGATLLAGAAAAPPAAAQVSPFQVASRQFMDSTGRLDYVAPLRSLLAGKPQFDPERYAQALATYCSFVGHPTTAAPGPAAAGPHVLAEAAPLLAERAQATRVVLLNEAHDQPAHRAYCGQLLRQLAPLGYTLFAVEALDPADTGINQRGFPISSSGFYTCEPTMGKLLRTARQGGFQLVSHEISASQEKEFEDWVRRSNYRDSVQAVNILAALRQHPQAKLVALVGHDHILEKERDGLKRLAAYLRELGSIDPLTIDQTQAYQPAAPQPWPGLLTTDGRTPAVTGDNRGYVDVQIIHPPATAVLGRPGWLFADPAARPVTARVPRPYARQRCLVQLYDRAEYRQYGARAVPLDQCLAGPGQRRVRLAGLAAGRRTVLHYQPAELDAL